MKTDARKGRWIVHECSRETVTPVESCQILRLSDDDQGAEGDSVSMRDE